MARCSAANCAPRDETVASESPPAVIMGPIGDIDANAIPRAYGEGGRVVANFPP